MSCERIDPREFHGPAAAQYTLNCLEELARSPKFTSYVRHIEYRERLYLTWFLAPFTLFAILYYHLAMFGGEGVTLFMDPSARLDVAIPAAPLAMIAVTALLLLYAIPCIVIAPFVGFFEEPGSWASRGTLVFLTCVNVALVSFGGPRLNYPPFLTTAPSLTDLVTSWDVKDATTVFARDILVRRALPLEGFLLAGYVIAVWRRSFWRRAWHPPLPLLTIPVCVGLAGVGWWAMVQTAIPLFLTPEGAPTSVADALQWSAVLADPVGAMSLCGTVAQEVGRRMWSHLVPLWAQQELPFALRDPATCLSLYLAASSAALVHLLVLLAKPVLDFVLGGLLFLLPVDPTIWGLTMLSSIGGFVALWRLSEESEYTAYLVGLGCLAAALLVNGFVA